ncbi:DNA polymerase alpha subunit B [Ixodes scapularis]
MDFIEDSAFLSELEIFGADSVTPECLKKLRELCMVYGQGAEAITSAWVAYTLKRNADVADMTVELLEQMELEELAKSASRTSRTPVSKKPVPRIFTANASNGAEDDILDGYGGNQQQKRKRTPELPSARRISGAVAGASPLFSPASFSPKVLSVAAKYASRANAGDVVARLRNQEGEPADWHCTDGATVSVRPLGAGVSSSYMFENLIEKADALIDYAERIPSLYLDDMEDRPFEDIKSVVMEGSFVTGRVLCDSSGKINANSLILEGSKSSYGHSVKLNLSRLKQFSVFPGQVIVAKGANANGQNLVLEELLEGKMLPFPSEAPQLEGPLHLVVACGPYTTSDTLSFEPLTDFTAYLAEHQPHVCVMIGPFVDCNHELIQKGNLPDLYETIFQKQIDALANVLEGTRTQVVLVPSHRDVHHENVFPTPPFRLEKTHKRIHCVPDPCVLDINGVVIGVTGVDVLLHMGKEELSFPPGSSDRLSRLAKHILTQHSFYPLYPPSESVNVDISSLESSGCLEVTPHLLVLPSGLRHFIKDVNGCVCINPEHMVKGLVGGSFARVIVRPVDKGSYSGSIVNDTTAEVVKI